MSTTPPRPWLAVLAVASVIVALFFFVITRTGPSPPDPATTDGAGAPPRTTSDGPAADRALPPARPPAARDALGDAFSDLFAPDDPAWAWSRVDLDALRQEMPENVFWEIAAPTEDPAVLERRRERREAENREWGRILSNTAPQEDIRSWYRDRQRISSDLVAFTARLLDEYGPVLPDRDRGLLELSQRMHRQRLEELPQRLQEALDRREAHVAAAAAWRAEQALFGGTAAPGDTSN